MQTKNATQVRKEWSSVTDAVIHEKPQFIKRTRDYMMLSNIDTISNILSAYSYHAEILVEDNGSVTVALDEIDIVENDIDEEKALAKLASAILDYSEEYYKDFSYWARGNRKAHLPYVLKALIIGDVQKIGEAIECRHGEI